MELVILVGSALAGALLVALFFLARQRDYKSHVDQLTPKNTEKEYTREEVAKHNKQDDLWVILKLRGSDEYKVYNLTDYVEEHPGGDGILNNAGGDSTEGFHGLQHPPRAFELVDDFCIGKLKD